MYQVLSKDTIESEIVPYIPLGKRGFKSKVPISEIINFILYKLKTDIQWYLLPVLQLFSQEVLHYKTVFGYYRQWCKAGIWKDCWSGWLSGQEKTQNNQCPLFNRQKRIAFSHVDAVLRESQRPV